MSIEPVNWSRPLAFAATGERAWFSHFCTEDSDFDPEGDQAVVTDREAAGYTYNRSDGSPIDNRAKAAGWICNIMSDQELAQARIAIKRAQHQRRMEREAAEGIETAGALWGSF